MYPTEMFSIVMNSDKLPPICYKELLSESEVLSKMIKHLVILLCDNDLVKNKEGDDENKEGDDELYTITKYGNTLIKVHVDHFKNKKEREKLK